MPYRHDFRIVFSVPGSTDPKGLDVSAKAMLSALEERLAEFRANPGLLRDLAGAPLSTTEQPRWVLRKLGEPGVVREVDGDWIKIEKGGIPPILPVAGEEAKRHRPGKGEFWCRADDDLVFDHEVLADLHSDDRVVDTRVDIRPWLADADPDAIAELQSDHWCYAESADHVAYHLETLGDPGALRLFGYLALDPVDGFTKEPVGFGLSVDGNEAIAWLRRRRPEVMAALVDDDAPEV